MKVITGGQSGVDQHALFAAWACGLETGGWAPLGWQTEEGAAPWLADYGLLECEIPGYPARTRRNVYDADAVLILGDPTSAGSRLAIGEADRLGRPVLLASRWHRGREVGGHAVVEPDPELIRLWLLTNGVRVVCVGGNRESANPGIGEAAGRVLRRAFGLWRESVEEGMAGNGPGGL